MQKKGAKEKNSLLPQHDLVRLLGYRDIQCFGTPPVASIWSTNGQQTRKVLKPKHNQSDF